MKWSPPKGTKVVKPTLKLTDDKFKYTRGSDVQATWRKYGWKPVTAYQPDPIVAEQLPPLKIYRAK